MTDQQAEDERGAEIVPFRPVSEVSSEPESPPVPPDDDSFPAEAAETSDPAERKVIYASITAVGERRPIWPVPLQRANIRGTVEQFAGLTWYRTRYHGLRSLWYLIAHAAWAIVGVVRLAIRQVHWAWLVEAHELRTDAVIAGASKEWRALHAATRKHRAQSFTILGVELAAALVVTLYLAFWAPWYVQAAAAVTAGILAARFGRPAGHRIVAPAVIPPLYEKPSRSLISDALGSLGSSAINRAIKDGPGIRFISDPFRDGPGWTTEFDLPPGVTARWLNSRREDLASGLRRPLSATWPDGVPAEHPGRVSLWIGLHDISKQKPPKHPLLKTGTADFFGHIPIGTDPRQRPVGVPLFQSNWLIGAAPGEGKTSTLRDLIAGAALDPICDVWIHEQAGKGDLEPFAQICHRYCSGLDNDAIAYSAESARMLRGELERRSALFKRVPKDQRKDGRVTRDLALRYHQLRPVVAVFDEAQNVCLHPEYGEQFAQDIAHVQRLGRAYGIVIIFATQRPDAQCVPSAISGTASCRFCLKVMDQIANDMILGTGSYKAGYNSAIFRHEIDAGLGWLKADGEPQIIKTYYLDEPASRRIADRARIMRDRAGVLSGYALGLEDDDQRAPRDVLADVLEVLGQSNGMHWGPLAEQLAERFPDRWADADGDAVSAQCRAAGVKSVDVKVDGVTLKGARRLLFERAIEQRDREMSHR